MNAVQNDTTNIKEINLRCPYQNISNNKPYVIFGTDADQKLKQLLILQNPVYLKEGCIDIEYVIKLESMDDKQLQQIHKTINNFDYVKKEDPNYILKHTWYLEIIYSNNAEVYIPLIVKKYNIHNKKANVIFNTLYEKILQNTYFDNRLIQESIDINEIIKAVIFQQEEAINNITKNIDATTAKWPTRKMSFNVVINPPKISDPLPHITRFIGTHNLASIYKELIKYGVTTTINHFLFDTFRANSNTNIFINVTNINFNNLMDINNIKSFPKKFKPDNIKNIKSFFSETEKKIFSKDSKLEFVNNGYVVCTEESIDTGSVRHALNLICGSLENSETISNNIKKLVALDLEVIDISEIDDIELEFNILYQDIAELEYHYYFLVKKMYDFSSMDNKGLTRKITYQCLRYKKDMENKSALDQINKDNEVELSAEASRKKNEREAALQAYL